MERRAGLDAGAKDLFGHRPAATLYRWHFTHLETVMKYLAALLTILWLVACASQPPPPPKSAPALPADQLDPGPFPQDYQLRIISWLRMNADDPDAVKILSIETPVQKVSEAAVPDKNLRKGEAVWESRVITQGFRGDPPGPVYHRFYFKNGVIRAVDLK